MIHMQFKKKLCWALPRAVLDQFYAHHMTFALMALFHKAIAKDILKKSPVANPVANKTESECTVCIRGDGPKGKIHSAEG